MARGHSTRCVGNALACGTLLLAGCFMEGYAGLILRDGGAIGVDSSLAGDDAGPDGGLEPGPDSAAQDPDAELPGDAELDDGALPPDCQSDPTLCEIQCEGTASCMPVCAAGPVCNTSCGASEQCLNVCSANTTCNFDCDDATSCLVTCEAGSICNIHCPVPGRCGVTCEEGANCALTCDGAGTCQYVRCLGIGTSKGGVLYCSPKKMP